MGIVFNIQKSCTNDGPGIRTTVFLKGCPLRCVWCHNPESHLIAQELFYYENRCIGCGRCVPACPQGAHSIQDGLHLFDRSLCTHCGSCVKVCPAGALEMVGEDKTAREVIEEVKKDKVFYDFSGGGMTVSGGEPLMQFDFALELLSLAKEEGLHTCVETCGFVPTEKILEAAKVTDLFLFDWKITDSALHKTYTGVENILIRENLFALDRAGAKTMLRCPIIPSVNDTEEHFKGIAEVANSLQNVQGIEVEPYHSLGTDKLRRLGKEGQEAFAMPSEEQSKEWIEAIQRHTKVSVKRG